MADASREQRLEMRVDWQVSMMTRTYDLTEEQQERVRAEVARMSDEYRQAMGSRWRDSAADPALPLARYCRAGL